MAHHPNVQADRLRELLNERGCIPIPAAGDALSAKLIEQEGFPVVFMSGFATSAHRLGLPDTQLISYAEMLDAARDIVAAVSVPVFADGDTGYGNMVNIRRTVAGFAQAGCAAVMIEDQVSPKRCGHTKGKLVVERTEAVDRIRAACDARDEGTDIVIVARTDARHGHGLSEAIDRAAAFAEMGADILFVEAPKSEDEMLEICRALPGHKMANLIEGGETPVLSVERLSEIGYAIATYPLTLMSSAMAAMVGALRDMKAGHHPNQMLEFADLRRRVGFDDYYATEARYAGARD